jgi:digeranylgeranylglycerophospholipid reductase
MKILVVGAGPAGLSTAVNASKSGHEVVVFEKNSSLGGKVCGEALGREALDFVGLEPSKRFIRNYVEGFSISFKGEFIREAKFEDFPYAPGYVVDKRALLEAMLEKAVSYGARISFNQRVERADVNGKILLQNGEIVEGDLIVCADGASTLARKYFDYSNHRFITCMQYRCSLPDGINPNYLYLDIIGEGYAWTFPRGDYANIGIGLMKGSSVDMLREYLDAYIRKLGSTPTGKIMSAPVSIGGPLKQFSNGKVVVAGESAGCVMPLSGEGIRFAIYCGSIAWHPDYREQFMKRYGKNMMRSLGMLATISRLSDKARIDLLKSLEDPIATLEGKKIRLSKLVFKPTLIKELVKIQKPEI